MPSVAEQIADVLEDGPGMVTDLVLELGMPANYLCGVLGSMVKARKVERRQFHLPPELHRSGATTTWLYSLRKYKANAAKDAA
jgi:hypothetical protein